MLLDLLMATGMAVLDRIGPVDRRKGSFRQIARDVMAVAEKRRVLCESLGWEPRARDVPSLAEYLKAKSQVVAVDGGAR